jgi:cytochrome c biogenesis protein CcmG/thiol:disulfide interchange protein DsbE
VIRFLLPLGAFALLVVVLIVGLAHAPEKNIIPSPLIGKSAPQFSLHNLFEGQGQVSGAVLRGHWSLVNVWGTWCGECRAEHEALLQIKREGQVPIIGIDWKDTDEDAQSWLTQLGNPYESIGTDHDGRVAIDWGVYGAPESFLVSPEGTVVYKQIGAITPQIWHQKFLPIIQAKMGSGA